MATTKRTRPSAGRPAKRGHAFPELRVGQLEFAKAFRASPHPQAITRASDQRFVAVNAAFERASGYAAHEVLGRTAGELGFFADEQERQAFFAKVQRDGSVRDECVRLRRKNGTERIVEFSVEWIDIDGEPHRLSQTRDITERKQAEAHALELNASLERRVRERTGELQEAVNELENFSYSVSHDLRAPVRAIAGFASILASEHGASLNEDGRRLLELVERNTRRMGELIEDLLALSRAARAPLERKRVDMRALVAGVIEDLGAGSQVTLAELPAAHGDPSLLRQVWQNLIANSIKFTRGTASPRIELGSAALADGMLEYSVRDNGCGFDMRHAGKLFQVFQRLHSGLQYEGTGAGLAIVQRIVARHGGRVAAEGSPGGGARFSFVLPA